ncbi:ribonuclease III domain-containing protein [Leptodontidium sp. MPI-SDFR-AT-0119]|nr:ribonuclease III domain-containing protein [Leptodontidium sp. MPI-SDFR-AT-0119]
MKRIRLERLGGQLLSPRKNTRPCCLRPPPSTSCLASSTTHQQIRSQSSLSPPSMVDEVVYEDGEESDPHPLKERHPSSPYPSPIPDAALRSAKLAALHARLSLPKTLPLQTMARTLVDPSADSNTNFNNASLAQIGGSLISFHVSEYLLCTYPRLPISVLFAAAYAYNGPKTLQMIGREWGVEPAAVPGSEVDPGYLQFAKLQAGTKVESQVGTVRADKSFYRRGMSSRVVYDDEFGDTIARDRDETAPLPSETAYSNFVKAVVGALYMHAGREAAKTFVKQHILSRHLEISTLFQFKEPVRELSRLCTREGFEYPVARILSETGRRSRSPVFVVGIYSGNDQLGEGAGASLPEARLRASVAALKAWYLYSPGNNVPVPSDTEAPNARPWEPVHIDMGEVIH